MIARKWMGKTTKAKGEEYSQFLIRTAIPDYKSVQGNLGLSFLRKEDNEYAYFELITYWDNIDSIKKFAGDAYETAKYYPEDSQYLLFFEEKVQHFEVFYHSGVNDPA